MSEHWSLPMIRVNLSFSFRLHFLCYTSSCMPSRLLHLKVPQILYSMHVLFSYCYTEYLYLLLKFCHCDNFNTAFGSCGYFNLPTVRSQRQPIFQDTLACTYSLVGLVQLLELGTKTGRVKAQLLGALNTGIPGCDFFFLGPVLT